jgi:putative molybdopterin biosynthesis protein
MSPPVNELLTTSEVAEYLRLKERKIYELVRLRRIPCAHATGKLLFPKQMIDLWVSRHTVFDGPELRLPPPVVAGSHDLLLEWALRESACELALLAGGSEDGLRRLMAGQAVLSGLHLIDPETGEYNLPSVRKFGAAADLVLIEWAKREQGLVLAPGNPHGIRALADIAKAGVRVARRQDGAGAQVLLRYLVASDGLRWDDLDILPTAALTETDLAACVAEGKADCGIAIRAVATRFRLDFIPLQQERFDLAMHRRDYFEPPVQALLRFAGTPACRARAAELGGYDLGDCGRVVYNA